MLDIEDLEAMRDVLRAIRVVRPGALVEAREIAHGAFLLEAVEDAIKEMQ